jgi:hypothetical protein
MQAQDTWIDRCCKRGGEALGTAAASPLPPSSSPFGQDSPQSTKGLRAFEFYKLRSPKAKAAGALRPGCNKNKRPGSVLRPRHPGPGSLGSPSQISESQISAHVRWPVAVSVSVSVSVPVKRFKTTFPASRRLRLPPVIPVAVAGSKFEVRSTRQPTTTTTTTRDLV